MREYVSQLTRIDDVTTSATKTDHASGPSPGQA
jgi:hypothetical protein